MEVCALRICTIILLNTSQLTHRTKYLRIFEAGDTSFLATGITSAVSTILVDSTMLRLTFWGIRVLTPIQILDLALLDGLGTALVDYSTSCSLLLVMPSISSLFCFNPRFITLFKIIYIRLVC
ncbi:hypothetical protein DFS33DRAFT_514216 [Desarmillaria ectypa]|nr:hypothetical protein DFS33DRAFT_514216 [Desarmillaria ectypa]